MDQILGVRCSKFAYRKRGRRVQEGIQWADGMMGEASPPVANVSNIALPEIAIVGPRLPNLAFCKRLKRLAISGSALSIVVVGGITRRPEILVVVEHGLDSGLPVSLGVARLGHTHSSGQRIAWPTVRGGGICSAVTATAVAIGTALLVAFVKRARADVCGR